MAKKQARSLAWYKKRVWLIFLGLIIFTMLFFFGISKGLLGKMPSLEEIESPNSMLATEVYAADSNIPFGTYYAQNRSNAQYSELPKHLTDALIATEDVRFYTHSGIDFRRTLSAIIFLGKKGGGSTITQQLAKNLFHNNPRSTIGRIMQKFKEIVMSIMIERTYTKEEILTMYLNTVDFIHNSFGIKAASKTYFNKSVSEIEPQESAVLVGMLKAPYYYNPVSNPENCKNRRNVVIYQMNKYNFIDEVQKDSLQSLPIVTDFVVTNHLDGIAPHFREQLRAWLKVWAKNTINPSTGKPYDIYRDGLKVYTTIDTRIQAHAEEAVKEHLEKWQELFFKHWKNRDPWKYYDRYDRANSAPKQNDLLISNLIKSFMSRSDTLTEIEAEKYINTEKKMQVWDYSGMLDTILTPLDSVKYYKKILQTGLLAIDQKTGHIKAWVGGPNFKYNQFDHVNESTKRQVGSTFKPLIYSLAIKEKGFSPCFKIPDMPICFNTGDPRWPISKRWCPENSGGGWSGLIPLKDALARSKNLCTAYLMHELSSKAVVNFAHNLGINSEIPETPAICLGSADISVYEMVRAYTTFANNGKNVQPIFVKRIEDSHGNIIEDFYPETKLVLDEQTAYVTTQLMKNVVDGPAKYVTGARVRFRYNIPRSLEIAAKTGTTQKNSDGWFIGFTPEILTGVWVGCDDKFVRFRSTALGQGASTALPIWAKFIKKVYADTSLNYSIDTSFVKPARPLTIELNCARFVNEEETELDADIWE